MIEFAEPRIIRPATDTDLTALATLVPDSDATLPTTRYERQKSGGAVYLLAVQGDVPVAQAFVTLPIALETAEVVEDVTNAEAVTPDVSEVPTIEDFFIRAEDRNRNVESRLLNTAERIVRERGFDQIAVQGVAQSDAETRAVLTTQGYTTDGSNESETMSRFVKSLEPVAATENFMENETDKAATDTPQIATPAEYNGYDAPTQTPQPTGRPISEQVVDFAFGVALTAAEALEQTVKTVRTEAPGVWESLQEKGRPAREKLVQSLREETREEAEAALRKNELVLDVDGGTTDVSDSPDTGDDTTGGDRKSTRLNSSHSTLSRMPSSA